MCVWVVDGWAGAVAQPAALCVCVGHVRGPQVVPGCQGLLCQLTLSGGRACVCFSKRAIPVASTQSLASSIPVGMACAGPLRMPLPHPLRCFHAPLPSTINGSCPLCGGRQCVAARRRFQSAVRGRPLNMALWTRMADWAPPGETRGVGALQPPSQPSRPPRVSATMRTPQQLGGVTRTRTRARASSSTRTGTPIQTLPGQAR
jgi:hypothetical protein